MFVKQLSVFIENRKGRLEDVTNVLKDNDINIVSISLADTNEYGLLRMIVSDPIRGKQALRDKGFSAMLTDVLAVRLPNGVGKLQNLLCHFNEAELNIEYMYILATGSGNDSMVIKVSDNEKASSALEKAGVVLFNPDEAYAIHE